MAEWFKIGPKFSGITLFGISICWLDLWTGKFGLEIGWYNRCETWLCIGFGESNTPEDSGQVSRGPLHSEAEPDAELRGRVLPSEEKLDKLVELIRRT